MLLEILRRRLRDCEKTSLISFLSLFLPLFLSLFLFAVLEDVRYVCVIGKNARDDPLLIAGRYQLAIFSAAYLQGFSRDS